MNASDFLTLILWLVVGLSVLITTLVVFGFYVEKREGLSVSYRRLYTALICSVLLGVVAFLNFHSGTQDVAQQPGVSQSAAEPTSGRNSNQVKPEVRAKIGLLESEKKELERQYKALNDKIAAIDKSISELNPSSGQSTQIKESIQRQPRQRSVPWFVFFGIGIIIFLFLYILFIDDTLSLLRNFPQLRQGEKGLREQQYQQSLNYLDQLAETAHLEKYENGLDLAALVEPHFLSKLQQIDFYFLKSFCAIQYLLKQYTTQGGFPSTSDKEMLANVEKDLRTLLHIAPRCSEAEYLSAVLEMLQSNYQAAIEKFDNAHHDIDEPEIDFKTFTSTCCLHLAAKKLANAEIEEADLLFARVITIGVAADRVPGLLLENRIVQVRQFYGRFEYQSARQALEAMQKVGGLTGEQKTSLQLITDSVNILLLDGERNYAQALSATQAFLMKWTPVNLPEPDDNAAEEFLFPIVREENLPFSAEIFCGFYFLEAILHVQIQEGRPPTVEQVNNTAFALLRALQFVPRHREVLAALGILYFYGKTDKRAISLGWLESSLSMGVFHPLVIHLVEKEKGREDRRSKLLDRFLSMALERLLSRDISDNMRKTLLDEWGQYKDFRPALQEINEVSRPEYSPLTLQAVLNRANYIQGFASEVNNQDIGDTSNRLRQKAALYEGLAHQFQQQMLEMTEIEKQIMQEIGKQVLR